MSTTEMMFSENKVLLFSWCFARIEYIVSRFANDSRVAKNLINIYMITKKTLLQSLEYLSNVTEQKYELSCQCAGRGKGYSVMRNGSHVVTYGHVAAGDLDLAIFAYAKGFMAGEKKEVSK